MMASMGLAEINPKIIVEGSNKTSLEWIHGPVKRRMEKILTLCAYSFFGFLAKPVERIIRTYYQSGGRVEIQSGFLEVDPLGVVIDRKFKLPKIKTMQPGSENIAVGHGQSSMFGPYADIIHHDPRVTGKTPALIRRVRVDEIPQLVEVIKGRMNLIGPRSYVLKDELRDLIILYRNRDNNRMGNLKWLFDIYPHIVHGSVPVNPGVFSPLSAYLSKMTPMDVRMLGDLVYLKSASPRVDLAILVSTLKRMKSGIGVQ